MKRVHAHQKHSSASGSASLPLKREKAAYQHFLYNLYTQMLAMGYGLTDDENAIENAAAFTVAKMDLMYDVWQYKDNPCSYAITSFKNELRSSFRSKNYQEVHSRTSSKEEMDAFDDLDSFDEVRRYEELLLARQKDVEACVETLHPTFRKTYQLLMQGLKPRQIGEKMKITGRHVSANKIELIKQVREKLAIHIEPTHGNAKRAA